MASAAVSTPSGTSTSRLRALIVLSGLGHVIHNVEEFGVGTMFLAQSVLPLAVTAAFWWTARRPTRRWLIGLGAWATVVAVVRALTIPHPHRDGTSGLKAAVEPAPARRESGFRSPR